jgi:hypothetical protein
VSADNVELRAFPASRYAPLIAASPFALDTRAIAPPVDEPNPFADFVIVTLAQIHDPATGTHDIVTIRSRKEPPTFWTLEGKTPIAKGFKSRGSIGPSVWAKRKWSSKKERRWEPSSSTRRRCIQPRRPS